MSYNNDQTDPKLPIKGKKSNRTSSDFLPKFFRTPANKKILQSTVDQFISEGTVDKINGYLGRRTAKAHTATDVYVSDVSNNRENYQLEPAVVIKDELGNISFFKDYNDYINLVSFFNGSSVNHNKLNSQEYYSWDPQICWDMFINYREYYWLPSGPQPVGIVGQQEEIVSTYTVTLSDEVDNVVYVFSPDGLKKNPSLRLYRGQTYRFEIDCPGHPMLLKTARNAGTSNIYNNGVLYLDINGIETVEVEQGVIEFTIPNDAPNVLFYVSKNDVNTSGLLKIFDIADSTFIDVEAEILGKKTYEIPLEFSEFLSDGSGGFGEPTVVSSTNIPLSNGMKIYFQGRVTPEKYSTGFWYVEGVGDRIVLIAEQDLETPSSFTENRPIEFDNEKFDTQGFDVNKNYPLDKDFITINRASKDRNPWSRYNRWFHKDVIEASARFNNQPVDIDQTARAVRPIIEFAQGVELFNFGKQAKANVTLIDTFTKDVFTTIEGSRGYNIDGVNLAEGMRILFTGDDDILVYGKIFKVSFITHLNIRRLTLIPEIDVDAREGETVLILDGVANSGKMFYFENRRWTESQKKTSINQPPLFDVFDANGVSFGDKSKYVGSNFAGTKLFSYKPRETLAQQIGDKPFSLKEDGDATLGFPLSFRNIENIGDIVFDFNYGSDSFLYQDISRIVEKKIQTGYLKINDGLSLSSYVNGWTTAARQSFQLVVRQYNVLTPTNFFELDMFVDPNAVADDDVIVYVNDVRQTITDFVIFRQLDKAYVQFLELLSEGDVVVIKVDTDAEINDNGFYEFPINLQNNPKNITVREFTLGEIADHVRSIAENIPGFTGTFPGTNNLRDLGNSSAYSTKIIQNSATLLPVIYHFADKNNNVVKALRYAKEEYSKFKRNFIRTITEYGFDGEYRVHLDLVLDFMTKDRAKTMPFYLTDMVPFNASFIFEQEIIDDAVTAYPLTFNFNLNTLSEKAALVYINEVQLIHGKDYIFENDNFIRILSAITSGDNLKIVQYESTDGCFVPPTPTKLGLYPLFEPQIFIDTTYQTPTQVIQGHDGSITVAFNDYRDELILELEKRIFNNIKIKYNPATFDIKDYVEGYNRPSKISRTTLNNTQRQDFLKWVRNIAGDYIKQDFYDINNSFTYSYKNSLAPNLDQPLFGFWRSIYKYFYDTDRPHSHPWEMLGFSEQPSWWQTVYGPAPYTRDNLVLWSDLAEGIVRQPGKLIVRLKKYIRPTLLSHIPADDHGQLLSPLDSGLAKQFSLVLSKETLTFGDEGPIETAWRRSSEYAFSLITSITLNNPADAFGKIFDRTRQVRDPAGQLVYANNDGNARFNTESIILPSTVSDNNRTFTSGLVNYIVDYTLLSSIDDVARYKNNLKTINAQIASKLGGFTNKDKFKLILDSRSPLSQGTVFIPQENYQIELNTSSPIRVDTYSGVIIEKTAAGYIIRGYSQTVPEFKYFAFKNVSADPVINIGGISDEFVDWASNRYYSKGLIVRYVNEYYRTTTDHESSATFDAKFFAKLPELPIVGGRTAILRRTFETDESILHYGAELETTQDVVDFILGYGKYLESRGFIFDFFNTNLSTVINWTVSVKEFLFWTTQNWSIGSLITLSPAAQQIKYRIDFSVVDNTYDNFFEYSILKADGAILEPSFTNSFRENNEFTLVPVNTADGIFYVELNPVQKEHILLLDNRTVFNDIIYDQPQGYRQERIKVLGYKTADWTGDFIIPGFVYDRASVSTWTPWKDYALGETVKHKEFYYSAKFNVTGTENFEPTNWFRLEKRPESQLIPNWDYRANQFADFYDLDTDSFDAEQQKFAQHLIGYQKRQYLENIINNEVSQYKFYQGMIQEKGTKNVLTKLFDALNSVDKESLEFYEEWAIRLGQYGGVSTFQEVEYILNESDFLVNPQPIELVPTSTQTFPNDFVYRITPDKTYVKSDNYTHRPFPTVVSNNEYVQTAGYVNLEDVSRTVITKEDLLNLDVSTLTNGDYIWIGFDSTVITDPADPTITETRFWDILRFTVLGLKIRSITNPISNRVEIEFTSDISNILKVDDYIAISNSGTAALDGVKTISLISAKTIVIILDTQLTGVPNINVDGIVLHKFISSRLTTINDLSASTITRKNDQELVWVDTYDSKWSVWKFEPKTLLNTTTFKTENFASSIFVSADDRLMLASAKAVQEFFDPKSPTSSEDDEYIQQSLEAVYYYNRVNLVEAWSLINILTPPDPTSVNLPGLPWNTRTEFKSLSLVDQIKYTTKIAKSFGHSIAVSADKTIIAIGAPLADTDTLVAAGYVAIFKQTAGNYVFDRVLTVNDYSNDSSIVATSNDKFGSFIKIENGILYVIAAGAETTPGKIFAFDIDALPEYSLIDHITLSTRSGYGAPHIIDFSLKSNVLAIARDDQSVQLYNIDPTSEILITEKELVTLTNINANAEFDLQISTSSRFVKTLDLTSDGRTIVIGIPDYSNETTSQGLVLVADIFSDFNIIQQIKQQQPREFELFGSVVKIDPTSTQAVISAFGGSQTYDLEFEDGTTFDTNSTTFSKINYNTNAVYVYDLYEQLGVFGDIIEIPLSATDDINTLEFEEIGQKFATNITVTDKIIYLNDPHAVSGNIFEYATTKSWTVYRQQEPIVDISKIKSVFLYNRLTNHIIERLDFVDPVRGKILGLAEQELSYKTYYDPAAYTVGTDDVLVDEGDPWLEKNVGKLWWNLKTTKFLNASHGQILFKTNTWNTVFPDSEVEVYEWVETTLPPDQWDALADTEEGLTQGISGRSKYGVTAYSIKQRYDTVSRTFTNLYYYWVKNKTTLPNVENRKLSARDVANYIEDPKSVGLSYIEFLSDNSFVLVNCKNLLTADLTVLNIKYKTTDKQDVNIHSHYQLLAENDPDSKPNQYIEKKWFDSLIGYDEQNQPVPDTALPAKLKYGILSKPRQGMFINRIEALKQLVERINSTLIQTVIVDDFDISELMSKDNAPNVLTNVFDRQLESYSEIRFITARSLRLARLSPVIVDGKFIKINILDSGFGYGKNTPTQFNGNGSPTRWEGPTVKISGLGNGAVINTEINSLGEITSVNIVKPGSGYTDSTILTVRPFTVLINFDETAAGKWTLYIWDYSKKSWFRSRTQKYDTTKYWEYADWYATGYNIFTKQKYVVNYAYELNLLTLQLGDVIKILNQGTGGWLLIEKIDDNLFNDITTNFKVVGRQQGTIQLKDNLYRFIDNNVGFDGPTFDNDLFDNQPKEELRKILNVIKNNILIDNLAIEYNKLFFASLRYAFSEQLFIDWAFKTSFVKSKHNLGSLEKKITYQNDNLDSYEDYINEVKPYRTKVREFVSSYDRLENSRTTVTDFDLPARFNIDTNLIEPFETTISNVGIAYNSNEILTPPYIDWLTNVGYQITEIKIVDSGSGYTVPPIITVDGVSEFPAQLKAYISKGKITNILIENPGSGYVTTPTITIDGSLLEDTGTPAKAIAILGNGLTRGIQVGIKFDRITPTVTVPQLDKTETFIASGSQTLWALKWPLDIKFNRVEIIVDNDEKLYSEFTVYNKLDTSAEYQRYNGYLQFTTAPASGSVIVIKYFKNIELLDAADRIEYFYESSPGKPGKDLGQLMQGVDYGGVELTGISFNIGAGWDALPWFTGGWDGLDPDYDDFLIKTDGSSRTFTLPYIPESGTLINVYLNNTRIDDPYFDQYDGSTVQPNGQVLPASDNIQMNTIIGNGLTALVSIPETVTLTNNDTLIFRKTTSDGSFKPDQFVYDTELIGGNLAYTNAKGISPDEINVDGDGFVTTATSHAPEEMITGQVADTVDITVYHKQSDGAPKIVTKFYKASGTTSVFALGQKILLNSAVIVKQDGQVLKQSTDYTVDILNSQIEFLIQPTVNSEIAVTSLSASGLNMLDTDEFVGDGSTLEFVTTARWNDDTTVFVTVNGEAAIFEKFITDNSYANVGNVAIAFFTAPPSDAVISYIVLGSNVDSISKVEKQDIILDGSTLVYSLNSTPFNLLPSDNNVIVDIDGQIIRPRDTIYFDVVGTNRSFIVDIADYALRSIDAQNIEVFVNGNILSIGLDYVWNSTSNQLTVRVGRVKAGDKLALTVLTNKQYQIIDNDIILTSPYADGAVLTVTTFSNHDILNIERNNDRFIVQTELTPGTASYYKFNRLLSGRIDLRRTTLNADYVWISLNNNLLTPNVDYVLEDNLKTIRLNRHIKLLSDDTIDVVAMESNISTGPFGYKIFKDILNRTQYLRLNTAVQTELAAELKSSDKIITVIDASRLEMPTPSSNIPGVIFINGERIEYFTKTETTLGQLRRGTAGTGVKPTYPIGTIVDDASNRQIVPYKDEMLTLVEGWTDGSTTIFDLNFVPSVQSGTTGEEWYRGTIPLGYGQCNELEIFIGGKRLHKSPRVLFDPTIGPYSPNGDYQVPAEFSVDGVSPEIRLTDAPAANLKIIIQKRVGKKWTIEGESLNSSNSAQAKFIRAAAADLPK